MTQETKSMTPEEQFIESRKQEIEAQLKAEFKTQEQIRLYAEKCAREQEKAVALNREARAAAIAAEERLESLQKEREKTATAQLVTCEVCGEKNIFSSMTSHLIGNDKRCLRNPRLACKSGQISKQQYDEIGDKPQIVDAIYRGEGSYKPSAADDYYERVIGPNPANPALQRHDQANIRLATR